MSSIEDIIDSPASLEVKRALVVTMILFDFKTEDSCAVLQVADSFVSKWTIIDENEGAGTLKVNYQGGRGCLTEDQRYEIIVYLRNKPHCSVEERRDYIERHEGVVYQSKLSYYDLLKAGGLSGHQTPAVNPKWDEAPVLRKRAAIKKKRAARQAESVLGEGIVFAEEEGH